MTNKHHIDIKKIANSIWQEYVNIRIQEKKDWEKQFKTWIKSKSKNSKEDY